MNFRFKYDYLHENTAETWLYLFQQYIRYMVDSSSLGNLVSSYSVKRRIVLFN